MIGAEIRVEGGDPAAALTASCSCSCPYARARARASCARYPLTLRSIHHDAAMNVQMRRLHIDAAVRFARARWRGERGPLV